MSPEPKYLIVEDEPYVRIGVQQILEDNGFAALATGSADEAMAILFNQPEITTIITDVFVPGTLDGMGLVNEIRRRWPDKSVVVTSGRLPEEAIGAADRTVFLKKPFGESDLLAALARSQANQV